MSSIRRERSTHNSTQQLSYDSPSQYCGAALRGIFAHFDTNIAYDRAVIDVYAFTFFGPIDFILGAGTG
jgi:hypothetical protein